MQKEAGVLLRWLARRLTRSPSLSSHTRNSCPDHALIRVTGVSWVRHGPDAQSPCFALENVPLCPWKHMLFGTAVLDLWFSVILL